MNDLTRWAIQWGVSAEALEDLNRRFGLIDDFPMVYDGSISEAGVQSRVRLEASNKGARLWRNNVGATYTDEGAFIRYGLANDSKQMNKRIKSADLIGIRPILIKHHHVGLVIGQFLSREIKPSNWTFTGTDHEVAQLNWIKLINSMGGDALFTNKEGTL